MRGRRRVPREHVAQVRGHALAVGVAGARGLQQLRDIECQSVLGSWVCVQRLFHVFLFLTASRMVLPKILVLKGQTECPENCSEKQDSAHPGQQ